MNSMAQIIGERIRALRETENLLQRELALKAGIQVRTVGRIERGECNSTVTTLTVYPTYRTEPAELTLPRKNKKTQQIS